MFLTGAGDLDDLLDCLDMLCGICAKMFLKSVGFEGIKKSSKDK